jgi:CheY-like chemotaxis protein
MATYSPDDIALVCSEVDDQGRYIYTGPGADEWKTVRFEANEPIWVNLAGQVSPLQPYQHELLAAGIAAVKNGAVGASDNGQPGNRAAEAEAAGAGQNSGDPEAFLLDIARQYAEQGSSEGVIATRLKYDNDEKCNPPLPLRVVNLIAASAYREAQEQARERLAREAASYTVKPIPLAELLQQTFEQLVFLVDGFLARGHFAVLGGRPKSGKSWLLLQLAQAIDTGQSFLGRATIQAKVLYIALEDGQRRVFHRCNLLGWRPQNGAAFLFELATFDGDGVPGPGLAQVDALAGQYDLIIIDTFAATRSGRVNENDNAQSAMIANYLARIAHERDVTIILSHHTRKGAADDPFDTLRGAGALRAGYDVGMVLQRKQDEREAILHCESRDVDVSNMTIRQSENGQGWECLGSGAELHRIRAGRAIVETILAHGEGETVSSLAEASGKSKATIGQQLRTAEEHGLVVKWTEPPKGRTKPAARWWLTEAAGGSGLPADLAEQQELPGNAT